MPLDAIIVADEFDSKPLVKNLIKFLLDRQLKPHVISPNFLWRFLNESTFSEPVLFFEDSSVWIDDPNGVLNYHRTNPLFPVLFSANSKIISINPSLINISLDNEILFGDGCPFTINLLAYQRLPEVTPPSIIVFSHNRAAYFNLTLNSLFFSLEDKISDLFITLVLSNPTNEVKNVALEAYKKHPSINIIMTEPNTYLATPLFAIHYYKDVINENIFILEDDFIISPDARDDYPNWPWWFSHRLQYFDLVNWAPSLDNMPNSVKDWLRKQNKLNVDRHSPPGNKWINSMDNYFMNVSGMAIGCSVDFYLSACQRSTTGYSFDTELEALAKGISIPKLLGYHIGWNQEQDGFPALSNLKRWSKPPQQAKITNLITGETKLQQI